jgi:hypothetical protein
MKKPNVVLKNVKFHEGQEGYGLNADVWIDKLKCIHIHNDGNGGCLNINILSYDSKNLKKIKSNVKYLNEYINSLPDKPLDFGHGIVKDKKGNVRMFKIDLEYYLNELTYEYERQKERKKQEKLMQKGILIGVPNGNSYSYFNYKRPLSEVPEIDLQQTVINIDGNHCKGDVVILNTNLKELGIII